jgi:hypothetical protein
MVSPPEATELVLEPGIPAWATKPTSSGAGNCSIFCRRHRLERLGPPFIEYTREETRIWREVSPKLNELHVRTRVRSISPRSGISRSRRRRSRNCAR